MPTDFVTNTTAITTMLTSLVEIFTKFPINIIIVLGLAGAVFGLFKKAKHAARG